MEHINVTDCKTALNRLMAGNKEYLIAKEGKGETHPMYRYLVETLGDYGLKIVDHTPHIHEDRFVEVSDDVAELFLVYRRSEASYARKARRYHAYFSLDRQDGIEQCIRFISISPEEHFERQLSEQQLYAALNSLPPKQARRIFAHYFDGISQAEIGRAEGITRESVNESLRRGLRKLKTFLENQ